MSKFCLIDFCQSIKMSSREEGVRRSSRNDKKYNLVLEVNMMCAFRHSKIIKKGKFYVYAIWNWTILFLYWKYKQGCAKPN